MEKTVEELFAENKYEAPALILEQVSDISDDKYSAGCDPEGTGGWGCCFPCERTN